MHPIALATGNAFILKPPSTAPSAALIVAELYKEAGLPDGLFQVVFGEKDEVEYLLDHPGIDAVSFVGSTAVAKAVRDRGVRAGKRVQALGGANNHAIIMPDADLDAVAPNLAAAAFGAAGERCMASPVVIAVGGIGDELGKKVAAQAKNIRVGYGMDEGVEMGAIITPQAKDRIIALIDDAEARDVSVVLDGRDLKVAGYEQGTYLGPTVLTHVPLDAPVYSQEVFGPVLVIVDASSYEEAIEILNSSPYGNGAVIFTESGGVARQFTIEAQAGMVGVNVPIPTPVAYYSFGGWKDSMMGDVDIHGPDGVRFYTREKKITTRWFARASDATLSFRRED